MPKLVVRYGVQNTHRSMWQCTSQAASCWIDFAFPPGVWGLIGGSWAERHHRDWEGTGWDVRQPYWVFSLVKSLCVEYGLNSEKNFYCHSRHLSPFGFTFLKSSGKENIKTPQTLESLRLLLRVLNCLFFFCVDMKKIWSCLWWYLLCGRELK